MESAEQEIQAAARLAQRELKGYAAELVISLARERMHIDAETDQALVSSFVGQLGAERDGKEGS